MTTDNGSETKVFRYRQGEAGYYLWGIYGFVAIITFRVLNDLITASGWVRYAELVLFEIVALALTAIIDHRRKNTYPILIRVDHTTVTLKRLWNYKRFNLSDVMTVDDPIEPSPIHEFYRPTTRVVFLYGGENCEMYISPCIDGYKELLSLLAGKPLPTPIPVQDACRMCYSFSNKAVWFTRISVPVEIAFFGILMVNILVKSSPPLYAFMWWLFCILLCWTSVIRNIIFYPVKIEILPDMIVCQMLYGWYIRVPHSDIVSVKRTAYGGLKLKRRMKPYIWVAPYFKNFESLTMCLRQLGDSRTCTTNEPV